MSIVKVNVGLLSYKIKACFFSAENQHRDFTVDLEKRPFSDQQEGRNDVQRFFKQLESIPADSVYLRLKKLIDDLPGKNFEAIVDILMSMNFQFPSAKNQPEIVWPEYLLEKLPICLDTELLTKYCKAYPWYIAASRRAVTIAHMSEKGLSKEFLEFVNRLTKTNSALAFALSPTTLHDNTLLDPKIAHHFTCPLFPSPNRETFDPQGVKTDYKPVFLNSRSDHVKLGLMNHFNSNRDALEVKARGRIYEAVRGIYDKKKDHFPWFHPTRKNTGVILAGGLPCAVMLDDAKWEMISKITDIDLFIYGDSEDDRKDMTRVVLEHLESVGGKISHFVSVFKVDGLGREIQVICPYARSTLGVLINFDSTFIQVGYQAGAFFATPGYCFFTPRSETLITRYNVRFHRMLKAIERGFMPVSDDRGHLMYPSKTMFSSRWPFSLSKSKPYGEEWITKQAKMSYIVAKKLKFSDCGDDMKNLKIEDMDVFGVLLDEMREKAEEHNLKEKIEMKVHDPILFNAKSSPDGKAIKSEVSTYFLNTTKPEIAWIPVTSVEEIMKDFHPQGATLSNGFDIYTAGVNSTLPIPQDGNTEDIYTDHVLLRNVKVLTGIDEKQKDGKRTYNLAAPEDKPLLVKHKDFSDPNQVYPERDLLSVPKEGPVREIEGIFLFSDIKDPKVIESEYQKDIKRREANAAKFEAMVEARRQVRWAKQFEKQKQRREVENQRRAIKGLPSLEEQAELDMKAIEARRKLRQAKEEAYIATKNAKEGIVPKKLTLPVKSVSKEIEKPEPAFVIDGMAFNHPEWNTLTEQQKNLMIKTAEKLVEIGKRTPLTGQIVENIIGPKHKLGEGAILIAKTFNEGIANYCRSIPDCKSIDLSSVNVQIKEDDKGKEELNQNGTGSGYFITAGLSFRVPPHWNDRSNDQQVEIIRLVEEILESSRDKESLIDEIVKILSIEVPRRLRENLLHLHSNVKYIAPKTESQVKKVIEKSPEERLREAQREIDIKNLELRAKQEDKKNFSLKTTIDFGDLHKLIKEPKDLVTIGVHELPLLYKAFAKGGKEYVTLNKKVIKRSDGMVKVRAPVAFDNCLVFDVDDLFVSQKSIDNHPERRYNAVVHLVNLQRWILKAHEHKDVITSSSSRELIMVALQEEMKKMDKSLTSAPVAEFMRALRHVANQKEFEEKANQSACALPHPHPGLPGEMPTLFISRLYVSKI